MGLPVELWTDQEVVYFGMGVEVGRLFADVSLSYSKHFLSLLDSQASHDIK